MDDLKWTKAEKHIARRAFDTACRREYDAVRAKLKEMAAAASGPEDVWEIHNYLSDVLKDMEEKYDYRYSCLLLLFTRLMRKGWLSEADLDGLGDDKTAPIKYVLSL